MEVELSTALSPTAVPYPTALNPPASLVEPGLSAEVTEFPIINAWCRGSDFAKTSRSLGTNLSLASLLARWSYEILFFIIGSQSQFANASLVLTSEIHEPTSPFTHATSCIRLDVLRSFGLYRLGIEVLTLHLGQSDFLRRFTPRQCPTSPSVSKEMSGAWPRQELLVLSREMGREPRPQHPNPATRVISKLRNRRKLNELSPIMEVPCSFPSQKQGSHASSGMP